MTIDSHQHFWKYTTDEFGWIDDSMKVLRRDFLPQDLAPVLRKAGVDGCVAVQARQSLEETRFLLDLAEQHPFIKGVVGWVDLRSPDVRQQLESFTSSPAFVGVRHIVQSEPEDDFLLRSDVMSGIAALESFGLVYDLLVYPKQLPAAIELVRKFPRIRFVLDHIAKPLIRWGIRAPWEEHLRELAKSGNVSCKVSGMVTEADPRHWSRDQFTPYLDVVFDAFGAERIMIGSDWPVCTVAGEYADVTSIVTDHIRGLTAPEREAVLGGTAERVYRLHR